jgi:hypothetical protein
LTRLVRDGWQLKQEGTEKKNKLGSKISWEFPDNKIWIKSWGRWSIAMRIHGLHERDEPWYVVSHEILDADGACVLSLGRTDWADWAQSDEFLFAKDGRLYRIPRFGAKGPKEPEELIDLRAQRFEAVVAPESATPWGGKPVLGSLLR